AVEVGARIDLDEGAEAEPGRGVEVAAEGDARDVEALVALRYEPGGARHEHVAGRLDLEDGRAVRHPEAAPGIEREALRDVVGDAEPEAPAPARAGAAAGGAEGGDVAEGLQGAVPPDAHAEEAPRV